MGITASAQGDPLAPLPDAPARPVAEPLVATPTRPTPSFVVPAAPTGFDAYRQRLTYIARAGGISEATIASIIPYLQLNSRVMRLDRGQPGAVGNTSYTQCGQTYYTRVSTGYQVVVLK